jgi:hypothetical protein
MYVYILARIVIMINANKIYGIVLYIQQYYVSTDIWLMSVNSTPFLLDVTVAHAYRLQVHVGTRGL